MVVRIYFLFRARNNYSYYADPFSKKICKEHNFYPSNWFILKVKNDKAPLRTVIVTTLTLIFIVWWWLLIFEIETLISSETTDTMKPEFVSLYLTMITLTTVGYGDICPETKIGRIIIMIAAVLGVIQISMVVNAVSNTMNLSENEKNAIDQIDHSRIAAKTISKSIKYLKNKKYYYSRLVSQQPDL